MHNETEIRTYCHEVRAAPAENGIRFEGYAAVFDSLSDNLGGFRERILRGAFRDTIANNDIRCLLNHDPNYVIGRNTSGTLTLAEDEHGLHFSVTAPDTSWARDLAESVRRGDISQCSFAFHVPQGGDDWKFEGGSDIRTLNTVILSDVSIVTYPAYEATSASVRAKNHRHESTEILRKKLQLLEGLYHE